MECFLLGSGGMMPMPRRWLTSVAVRTEGRIYLFDCGEGTQIPYKKQHLGLRSLDLIAVSHLHADHVLGLPGMLMLRAQMPDPPPIRLVGTPGLRRFVRHVRADLRMYINYTIEVTELDEDAEEIAYSDDIVQVRWQQLDHTVRCVGYRIEEPTRPGRFDVAAAEKLGVPRGPLWGKLQAGEPVRLPDGRAVQPREVLGPDRRGRRVAYATDTALTSGLDPLLEGADLAFVESMFAPEEEQDAAEKKHMTVIQAAEAAERAGVKRLVLVHVSPRYEPSDLKRLGEVARRHHPNATVGRDGQVYEVPLPE